MSENMDIIELRKAYTEGKIEKKLYWRMLRERFLPLIEYQKSLKSGAGEYIDAIEITENDIIIKCDGINFAFDFSQTFCRAEGIIAMGGNPEQADFDFIGTLIKTDDIVLDIGANVGLVSLSILKAQPDVKGIYAFEPLPDTFAKMKHNLELNGSPAKIHPVNAGMSDRAGTFEFYLPGENEAASMQPNMDEFYMQESVDGHYTGKKKMDKVDCQVTTVDKYVEENNIDHVNFIKIDVEGNERNVLVGGDRCSQEIPSCGILRNAA